MKLKGVEGFILAGGKSRRMGRPKALLEVGGRPIVARVAETVCGVFERVRVVTDRPEEVSFLGLPTIPDVRTGKGPLGGLHAALTAASEKTLFLISADLPFVSRQLISTLHRYHPGAPATLVSSGGHLNPLCAFYDRSILGVVEEALADGDLSVQGMIGRMESRIVPQEELQPLDVERLLFNVNTPGDLERAREIAEAGSNEASV